MNSEAWLVVGLGNPGDEYAATRHNIGYLVTDALAERVGAPFRVHKSRRADVVQGRVADTRLVLMRSRSYMNDSGGAVSTIAKFYDVPADRLIVVHDELDIGPGQIRVKRGGGDNGHNGLKSIRSSLGTGEWFRVRVGIGRPSGRQDVHDFVLSRFTKAELDELPTTVEVAADAVESLMSEGLEKTQGRFNS